MIGVSGVLGGLGGAVGGWLLGHLLGNIAWGRLGNERIDRIGAEGKDA